MTARDLGTLGGRQSRAIGINDNGAVVGWSLTGTGAKRAFKWRPETGIRALATLSGRACQANHISNTGQVAGFCLNASGQKRAVVWSATGQLRGLGTLPGGTWSQATDVNGSGLVVGSSQVRLGDRTLTVHPFRWTAARGMRDVTPGLGRSDCGYVQTAYAQSVNRSGQVVGTVMLDVECDPDYRIESIIRWSPSNDEEIHIERVWGSGINDLGDVVGTLDYPNDAGFRRRNSGSQEYLPTLGGNPFNNDCGPVPCTAHAISVNNAGLVVGWSVTPDGLQAHAVVWTNADVIQELGTLPGGTTSHANDVNNYNQAAGWSTTSTGASHAVLWRLQ